MPISQSLRSSFNLLINKFTKNVELFKNIWDELFEKMQINQVNENILNEIENYLKDKENEFIDSNLNEINKNLLPIIEWYDIHNPENHFFKSLKTSFEKINKKNDVISVINSLSKIKETYNYLLLSIVEFYNSNITTWKIKNAPVNNYYPKEKESHQSFGYFVNTSVTDLIKPQFSSDYNNDELFTSNSNTTTYSKILRQGTTIRSPFDNYNDLVVDKDYIFNDDLKIWPKLFKPLTPSSSEPNGHNFNFNDQESNSRLSFSIDANDFNNGWFINYFNLDVIPNYIKETGSSWSNSFKDISVSNKTFNLGNLSVEEKKKIFRQMKNFVNNFFWAKKIAVTSKFEKLNGNSLSIRETVDLYNEASDLAAYVYGRYVIYTKIKDLKEMIINEAENKEEIQNVINSTLTIMEKANLSVEELNNTYNSLLNVLGS